MVCPARVSCGRWVLLCFTAVAPWSVLGLISYPSCREFLRRRAVYGGTETLCMYVAISGSRQKPHGLRSANQRRNSEAQVIGFDGIGCTQRLNGPDKLGFQAQSIGASNRLQVHCLVRCRKPRNQLVCPPSHRWRNSSPAPKLQPKEAQLIPCRLAEAINKCVHLDSIKRRASNHPSPCGGRRSWQWFAHNIIFAVLAQRISATPNCCGSLVVLV